MVKSRLFGGLAGMLSGALILCSGNARANPSQLYEQVFASQPITAITNLQYDARSSEYKPASVIKAATKRVDVSDSYSVTIRAERTDSLDGKIQRDKKLEISISDGSATISMRDEGLDGLDGFGIQQTSSNRYDVCASLNFDKDGSDVQGSISFEGDEDSSDKAVRPYYAMGGFDIQEIPTLLLRKMFECKVMPVIEFGNNFYGTIIDQAMGEKFDLPYSDFKRATADVDKYILRYEPRIRRGENVTGELRGVLKEAAKQYGPALNRVNSLSKQKSKG